MACWGRVAGSLITPAVMWIPYMRMYTDDYDWTADLMRDWLETARQTGSAVLTAFSYGILAEAQFRRGALRDSMASAEAGWSIGRELGATFPGWWITLGCVVQAQLHAGEAQAAAALLDHNHLLRSAPTMMLVPLPRAVRGEVLIAVGRVEEGVEELASTVDWVWTEAPSPGAWRFPAVLVDGLLRLERHDEAGDIARSWLRRTRHFGTQSTIGIAERALALTLRKEAQLDGLRRAEQILARTPARAEHARALVELGAALRRGGSRTDARAPLKSGLDLATRCGAGGLAKRATEELVAAGARPRRAAITGIDALTPSERRIAELAAEGLTNGEIARSLFVSRKTVERHLMNAYLKLGTNSRTDLQQLIRSAG